VCLSEIFILPFLGLLEYFVAILFGCLKIAVGDTIAAYFLLHVPYPHPRKLYEVSLGLKDEERNRYRYR
jgi:hypothetical protein